MKRELILGPPGTGKTYTLMRELEGLQRDGFDFREIGFVSFTRKAMQEARDRAKATFGHDEPPEWFRTLHSAFWRYLGLGGGVKMKAEDWRKFAEDTSYEITAPEDSGLSMEEGFHTPSSARVDDDLMRADEWARCRMGTLNDAAMACGVHLKRLEAFSVKFRRWKAANGKMDFTDVLEEAVRRGARLPVSALIVDEAQDLNPLQIRAIGPTIDRAEVVFVAGDDDQAIFTFAGAEPEWLMSLSANREWVTRVLSQSYRVPRAVHRVAQAIIAPNKRRVQKEYAARDDDGSVTRGGESLADEVADALKHYGGTAAILGRTRRTLEPHINALFAAREVSYVVMRGRGPNPLGSPNVCAAIKTAAKVVDGDVVTRAELSNLLDQVPGTPRNRYMPWGVKAKVAKYTEWRITPDDIEELGLDGLRDTGRARGPVAMLAKLKPEIAAWHAAMWKKHGKVPEPVCFVSTIHGVKGGEFDTVAIDPTHPAPVEREMQTAAGREGEARVAYVGVTRAKKRLIIGRQRDKYGYKYP